MSENGDLETLAGIFEDEIARTILAETSDQPMTVNELADHLDASKPTLYRRIDRLEEYDLVTACIRTTKEGPQEKVFRAAFDRLVIDLEKETYSYQLECTERMTDPLLLVHS